MTTQICTECSKYKADNITQDQGWGSNQYETELGIPEWLYYLKNTIYEGLPNKESEKFPVQFLQAVLVGVSGEQPYKLRCGCDLDYQRLATLLEKQEKENPADPWGESKAIKECIRLYDECSDLENDDFHSSWTAQAEVLSAESAQSEVWERERDRLLTGLAKLLGVELIMKDK